MSLLKFTFAKHSFDRVAKERVVQYFFTASERDYQFRITCTGPGAWFCARRGQHKWEPTDFGMRPMLEGINETDLVFREIDTPTESSVEIDLYPDRCVYHVGKYETSDSGFTRLRSTTLCVYDVKKGCSFRDNRRDELSGIYSTNIAMVHSAMQEALRGTSVPPVEFFCLRTISSQ